MAVRRAGAGDAGGAGERPGGLRAAPPRQRRRHEQVPHHRQARAALQQRELYSGTRISHINFRNGVRTVAL